MDRYDDIKHRIKEATDIVAMLEGSLALRPRGRTLVGLCPFHQEKSPSFTVFRDTQSYYCFGCAKSGDVFTWLMEREGLSFREAVERLAERAGISLEGVWKGDGERRQRTADATQVLATVRDWFRQQLQSEAGAKAREYLQSRGLEPAVLEFGLGFHPLHGLQAFAQDKGLPRDVLEAAGLCRPGGYEPLVGRLVFPIEDERGRVVAFGGRVVPGIDIPGPADRKPPKYLNSPESPLFSKRRILYGLHRAKQANTRRIVVVEGYTDVIACHLAGFTGAVATLGTAFTAEHARVLERFATGGAVLLFDGDAAGEQAAQRAVGELLETRLDVKVALLGELQVGAVKAKDAGDLLVQRAGDTPEQLQARRAAFADMLDGSEPALTVYFRLLRKRVDLSQAVHHEAAARECGKMLDTVKDPARREFWLQDMARHLAVPPQTLARMLKGPARTEPETGPVPVRPVKLTPLQQADMELLACVLADPFLAQQTEALAMELPAATDLLALCREGVKQGRTVRADLVRFLFTACAERTELQAPLALAAERSSHIRDPRAFWQTMQEGRSRVAAERSAHATRQQLQAALASGDRARADELTHQLVADIKRGRPREQDGNGPATPPSPGHS